MAEWQGWGKRLWPLSNDIRSKQFIKIFIKEDGTYESMAQVSAIHNQLTEAMENAKIGEAILDEKCGNVQIINELDVPILAMGLSDVVISASPDENIVKTQTI